MADILINVPDEAIEGLARKARVFGKPLETYIREILISGTGLATGAMMAPDAMSVEVISGLTGSKGTAERQGRKWMPEEDEQIVEKYRAGLTIAAIAIEHRRSRGAIASRLARLGLMLPTYGDPI